MEKRKHRIIIKRYPELTKQMIQEFLFRVMMDLKSCYNLEEKKEPEKDKIEFYTEDNRRILINKENKNGKKESTC